MRQADVHAEAGHQTNDALRHGQRFAIARGIGPGHGDLLAFEVFQASEVFLQPGQIGHGLGGVINIALQIHQRRALRQYALCKPVIKRCADFAHVGIPGTKEHVVANPDHVCTEGNHVGGFAYRFAVSDLRFPFVQVLLGQPQKIQGGSERETGARRVVTEDRNTQAAVKNLGGNVFAAHTLERLGDREHLLELIRRLFPGQKKVLFMRIGFQRADFLD